MAFGDKVKMSLKDRFKENELGFRLLIGFICWISLALFFHFREIRISTLELGTLSNEYVVASVDFEFPDKESMFLLKKDAFAQIGAVYQINENALRQIHYNFEYWVSHDSSWRKTFPEVPLKMMNEIGDGLKGLLKDFRFVDPDTRKKMKEYGIPVADFYIFSPSEKTDTTFLSKNYWEKTVLQKLLKEEFPAVSMKLLTFVIDNFTEKAFPLVRDFKIEKNIKDYIINVISQRYVPVKSGTKIIGEGEKVEVRHIAMLEAMRQQLKEKKVLWSPFMVIGNLLLSLIFIILSFLYLKIDQKAILKSLQKLSLLVCIVVLTLAFSKVIEFLMLQNVDILDKIRYPIIVPFAAILFFMLFNSRMALYGASFLSIILALTLAVNHNHFLILNLITSFIVIVSTKSLRRRKEVFEICGRCLVVAIPVILAFNFISLEFIGNLIISDIVVCIVSMIIIAILVVGILPLLEALFNVMTDITLMEYMDPNNELLKRLTLEMGGTYQHSLVLGNLAEIAAQAIGSNGLLCRVATLYHDIGKLANSNFFTENQQEGVNIHQLLTPAESAQVIISHIKDGVMLAKKYRLPQSFIDIIQQHHGTTLVYYFYHKELELQGGDKSKVDISKFRYPGPKPQSKEASIIMIADGVEAGSRTEEVFTEEALNEMINKVIKEKADDGQFDECDLSFRELKIIKDVLVHTLISTRHVRVKYPNKTE